MKDMKFRNNLERIFCNYKLVTTFVPCIKRLDVGLVLLPERLKIIDLCDGHN